MIKCHVEFNNGISKNFYSGKNETEILKKILEFCERYGVETIEGRWRAARTARNGIVTRPQAL